MAVKRSGRDAIIKCMKKTAAAFFNDGDNCMSKFSEYLRELLHSQERSIAGIAKNAGLERTSIHKALRMRGFSRIRR